MNKLKIVNRIKLIMVKDKNKFFEKFVNKIHIINPNLDFNINDWIEYDTKIKGHCKLHNRNFEMYKATRFMFNNCPQCKVKKQFIDEELKDIYEKIKHIDEDYKEQRKKVAEEKYNKTIEKVDEDVGLKKILEETLQSRKIAVK